VNTLTQLPEFAAWFNKLGDPKAKQRINARIAAAQVGNFGDCEPVGDGVSEMRIHYGPGYRVYLKRTGAVVYVLLCGGSKSGQQNDIKRAKKLAKLL
jgi:putative addiction module killer protein